MGLNEFAMQAPPEHALSTLFASGAEVKRHSIRQTGNGGISGTAWHR